MNSKNFSFTISNDIKNVLKEWCSPRLFQTEMEIIYEGHTPLAGYFIVDGLVQLSKKRKIINTLTKNHIFGVNEVLAHGPFPYTAKIKPGTQVYILDKSTLKEIFSLSNEALIQELTSLAY